MTVPLTESQRYFFSRIREAVVANPFSRERDKIDLEITGLSPDTPI